MHEFREKQLEESLRTEADRRFKADIDEWESRGLRLMDELPPRFSVEQDKKGKIVGTVKYFLRVPNKPAQTLTATLSYTHPSGKKPESWNPDYVSWRDN